jgi:hypothetical protein
MQYQTGREYAALTEAARPRYYVGLDLGQAADYTALCLLEQQLAQGAELVVFHARYLYRYPLGTSYPAIVEDVCTLLERAPLPHGVSTLIPDATGCGAAVIDLFRRERQRGRLKAELKPVLITGGETESRDRDVYRVPKRGLVSSVQVALQTGRLKVAASLPETATLVRELQTFKVKISLAGNDSYGAWREGEHDDLVLATSLALWAGTRPRSTAHVIRRE